MFNPVTGAVAPARCGVNTCSSCAPIKAYGISGAIALARYERSITLTQVGDDWQTIRRRMRKVRHEVQNAGHDVQWAWHVEPNPEGTGHHVHAFQRGSFIPQAELSRIASAQGMGSVCWITRHKPKKGAQGYGLKLVGMPYGMKGIEAQDGLRTYLSANGGRLVHTSRDFWRDEHGKPCGQAEAITAARRARNADEGTEPGSWQLVRKSDLTRAAEGPTKTP